MIIHDAGVQVIVDVAGVSRAEALLVLYQYGYSDDPDEMFRRHMKALRDCGASMPKNVSAPRGVLTAQQLLPGLRSGRYVVYMDTYPGICTMTQPEVPDHVSYTGIDPDARVWYALRLVDVS